jgi:hypothetical protein
MRTQEKMFGEVESWMRSGSTKAKFLEGKSFSSAKFNYWLAKWKAHQEAPDGSIEGFRELNFSEIKLGKVLEIEAPSGVKITVFA